MNEEIEYPDPEYPESEPNRTEVYFGKQAEQVMNSHKEMMKIHYRALACHCECLGMNAENSFAVCNNLTPPYDSDNYLVVMKKWKLTNEKGEPLL